MAKDIFDCGEFLRLFAPNGFGFPGGYPRFKDWLCLGSYAPIGLVEETSFVLRPHNKIELTGVLTEEFCSSSLSCIESMIEVERGSRNNKALAWPAIEAYYSSFFAAHTIMRFFGTGCTWLTLMDMARLKSVSQMHGALSGVGPRKGQWKYSLLASGDIEFKLGGGGSGGAHDVVWDVFSDVLDKILTEISQSILIPANDAQKLMLLLGGLRRDCKITSNIRNGVNYRREYGVWYPYTGFDSKFDSSMKRVGCWRDGNFSTYSVSDTMPPLVNLFNFSYAMARLCISLSRAGAKYFEGRGKRFSNGPLKLCSVKFV